MADPNPAAEATAIQSTAPTQPPSTAITDAPAPAPPLSEPAPPALIPVRLHNFDRTLVGLVLLLAFFLGSFAIQNSDLWMHLAVGRAVAQGNYPFGSDPFSYTSEGVYWANHSWLFDWLLYILYQLTGGTGLAVFRGLLCLALAAVLLSIRRPGQSLFLPACCTALALLGVSMRFHLNSLLVSYLFLALTLFLLHRAVYLGATFSWRGRSFSPLWLLPPLFALWVNLDGWFLLGPLVVALFLIGSLIPRLAPKAHGPRPVGLTLVLLAGLAACLLNPYFHRAFVLPLDLAHFLGNIVPPSLAPGAAAARHAADVAPRLFGNISPFEEIYWGQPTVGQNVAGLSYFVLLFLGAGSWVMRGLSLSAADKDDEGNPVARYPTELFLIWLLFAVVSAWNTRFIGLYAVVAGPVCALNLQAVAGRWFGAVVAEVTPPQRNALLAIRLGPIALCLLLLFLAWPGWLHAASDDVRRSHRVRWEVQVDPLLPHAGARLNELLGTGKLHRGFNLAPEQGYYWAWFVGPTAKTFFDARFAPFPQAAETFFQVRKTLREDTQAFFTRPPRIVSLPEVLKTFRLVDISYVLLTVTDRQMRNESRAFFSGKKASKEPPRLAVLHKVFRDHDVNYLVLSGMHQDDEQLRIAARLLADPREWVLLYADGRTAIFGWRDPEKSDNPFAGLRLDFNRLAFGTVPGADSGQPGRRAPEKTPDPPDGPPGFWSRYLFGQAPPPPSLAEARFYLLMYQLVGPSWQRWHDVYFEMQTRCAWLGPIGAAGTLPAMVSGSVAVSLPQFQEVRAPSAAEAGVALEALPLLAVRAARRGTAENPADANAYVILAQACHLLARSVEERWAPSSVPVSRLPSLLARPAVRH
ncbi:MAG TPA: hypothetical protein VEL76_17760, partial [Gemmataceae bacterium]|nr:hypothetical protein [Gemmataceae bacterium]